MFSFKDQLFFDFLIKNSDKKQNIQLIKFITKQQLKSLKVIATQILNQTIIISKSEYKKLVKSKSFIRKLGVGKVTTNNLIKNYNIVLEIIKIGLKYYETNAKTCFNSNRKLEQNKRKISRYITKSKSEGYCSSETLSSSSSERNESESESESSTSNEEEEEKNENTEDENEKENF